MGVSIWYCIGTAMVICGVESRTVGRCDFGLLVGATLYKRSI